MEPYLNWNGIEIANGTRTNGYLQSGLGPSGVSTPGTGCECTALKFGGTFVSPSADGAPWYEPARPESAQFLGYVPWTLNLVPSMARTSGPAGVSGSAMGRLTLAGTVLQASGWLISSTAEANEFGERWLLAALRSQTDAGCAGCDIGTATLLPACTSGFRTLYRCGLIDYVAAQAVDQNTPWFYFRQVSFQLRSELPWMFYTPVTVVNTTTTWPAQASTTTGTWPGESGMKITIVTGTTGNVGPILITGTVTAGLGSNYSLSVGVLPPSSTLVIDGATLDVSLTNQAGQLIGGIDALDLSVPFSWPQMGPQSTMTWRVALNTGGVKNANTSAKIERIDREV